MKVLPALLVAAALTLAVAPAQAWGQKKDDKEPDKVSYAKHIRPLFVVHCQGCHQPAKAEGGYVMTGYKHLLDKTDNDEPGIIPGQPDKSKVMHVIVPQNGKPPRMPR